MRAAVKIGSFLFVLAGLMFWRTGLLAQIGSEVAVPVHLQDGQEYQVPLKNLIAYGEKSRISEEVETLPAMSSFLDNGLTSQPSISRTEWKLKARWTNSGIQPPSRRSQIRERQLGCLAPDISRC